MGIIVDFVVLILDMLVDNEVVMFGVVYFIVWYLLCEVGCLFFGECVFIYFVIGGVGMVVVLIVKMIGVCIYMMVGLDVKWEMFFRFGVEYVGDL